MKMCPGEGKVGGDVSEASTMRKRMDSNCGETGTLMEQGENEFYSEKNLSLVNVSQYKDWGKGQHFAISSNFNS